LRGSRQLPTSRAINLVGDAVTKSNCSINHGRLSSGAPLVNNHRAIGFHLSDRRHRPILFGDACDAGPLASGHCRRRVDCPTALINLHYLLGRALFSVGDDGVARFGLWADISANLAANAFSTCCGSVAANWFLVLIFASAHNAASSAVLRPSISGSNWSRKLADRAAAIPTSVKRAQRRE
jgi:hypothetical protein